MKPHVRRGKKAKASRKERAEFRARLVSSLDRNKVILERLADG